MAELGWQEKWTLRFAVVGLLFLALSGFEGLLMRRSPVLAGILNGVDTTVWNPATDPHLEARYDSGNLAGKAQVKAALQRSLGLRADPQAMLVGVVTRLAYQKGVDLLVQSMRQLAGERVQLALLGSGDPQIERDLAQVAGVEEQQVLRQRHHVERVLAQAGGKKHRTGLVDDVALEREARIEVEGARHLAETQTRHGLRVQHGLAGLPPGELLELR